MTAGPSQFEGSHITDGAAGAFCRAPVAQGARAQLEQEEQNRRQSVDEFYRGRCACLRIGLFGIQNRWSNAVALRILRPLSQLC
jgi:hypothetical protein